MADSVESLGEIIKEYADKYVEINKRLRKLEGKTSKDYNSKNSKSSLTYSSKQSGANKKFDAY